MLQAGLCSYSVLLSPDLDLHSASAKFGFDLFERNNVFRSPHTRLVDFTVRNQLGGNGYGTRSVDVAGAGVPVAPGPDAAIHCDSGNPAASPDDAPNDNARHFKIIGIIAIGAQGLEIAKSPSAA